MDIYDPGLMAANGRADGTATPTGNSSANKTELDQNVEKLVGNISNWWTGFAKKSQDSITQARKEMETRGGIVNYAKSEYAKLESSIGDAQKKAREQSQQPQEVKQGDGDTPAEGDASPRSEVSKGKQRAVDDQDPTLREAAGPTLGASVSSLFSKLTSDPRLVQLQHSLTSTLQSVSSPTADSKELGDGADKASATATPGPKNLQESLSRLSLTIQSHLPHLDLKESQQLASRYMQATESFAREVQSDMKEFVGELVRIVPPEEEDKESRSSVVQEEAGVSEKTATPAKMIAHMQQNTNAPVAATESSAPQAEAAATEEEDFAWDEDDDEVAAAGTENASAAVATKEQPVEPLAAATHTESAKTKADESEEDSDWE
ncbi:hypothetical protein PHSY_004661 [Pseudozyma hubeiensis SY62]|uniref:BSD domain-containing protein n=1 Tax=Pseudozyma hubeiensis (strain SY62) TaxID=1305764 RepID=R9P748_PSEHS|nr:hypothetical protein PHSY_004661 [Pseudozyma hubeiensis SY62]GAC97077.1 hypothetical protein PHSY_004661 [Pseudozyma hubeiensis SY62]